MIQLEKFELLEEHIKFRANKIIEKYKILIVL